jgi:capsular polysaccharide biosynthesis protein/Mrp family chromosome partitioning ATPase
MELAFLTSAIRRYWWIPVIAVVLGSLPAIALRATAETRYESKGVLIIAPPSESRTVVSFQGDPDRYVAGEMSVLESLSDRVADEVDGVSAADLADNVTFEQQPLTDVVIISAKAAQPKLAQSIVDTYIDVYFEVLRAQLDGRQDPALEALDQELDGVREQLREVDADIADALAPYVGREPIPTIEQVSPGLASDKQILLNRHQELETARNELSSGLRISSRIVRNATLPTHPIASPVRSLLALGAVGGGFVGLLIALVVARLSPTVLDDEQAEEILLHPVLGHMPVLTEAAADRTALLDDPGPDAARFLDSVGVRVEAARQAQASITVVVTGTRVGAGSTTLAAALARRLANDSKVLLVDADRRQPVLTGLFMRGKRSSRSGGTAGERRLEPAGSGGERRPERTASGGERRPERTGSTAKRRPAPSNGPVATGVQSLSLTDLAGLGGATSGGSRLDAAGLIAAGSSQAEVVVFDGGPLMDSATTVQLSRMCDAVVLAVPERQEIRLLETVAAELRGRDQVLPVWTPAPSRSHRRLPFPKRA